MFRKQPQAFIALPRGPVEPALRALIGETLDRHGVEPLFADESLATSPSIQELLRNADLPMDLRAQQVAIYKPRDMGSIRRYLELSLRDSLGEDATMDS